MLCLDRELAVGDVIFLGDGNIDIITNIIEADYCITDGKKTAVRIEYLNTEGVSNRWVSDVDGGTVKLFDEECLKNLKSNINTLGEYYDPYTGRFIIPFNKMHDVRGYVVKLLDKCNYGMSFCGGNFVLFSLLDDVGAIRELNTFKKVYSGYCATHIGLRDTVFSYIDFVVYRTNLRPILDMVKDFSEFKWVDGWSIALVGGIEEFRFVEVLNCCV